MRLPRDVRMPLNGQFRFGTGTLAAAGSGQSTAAAVVSQITYVTAADGTKAVRLPAATLGLAYFIINTSSSASLPVYPASGDDINGGSADAAFTLGPLGAQWFVATSGTDWYTEPSGALTASAAEINRATDLSARIVPLAVTTPITEAAHEGRTIVMSGAGAARTFTLPAATGGGGRYRFVVGEVNTSNYLIKAAVGTDLFEGVLLSTQDAGDTVVGWESGATDDTVTLNGTTTGGAAIGDWIEFEDISATGWAVRGVLTSTGAEATPFSDTVA